MVVLLSALLKDFCEKFHTATILPCTTDECDRSYKNLMKTLIKWFRKYIFWKNDIRHINSDIWAQYHPLCILLEGFSWVIPYLTHPASSGSESAKDLPVFKMPPNEKFSSEDVDISFLAVLYHPLSIAIENRAVSITGMKLWYCLHRSRLSTYINCSIIILIWSGTYLGWKYYFAAFAVYSWHMTCGQRLLVIVPFTSTNQGSLQLLCRLCTPQTILYRIWKSCLKHATHWEVLLMDVTAGHKTIKQFK
jgi:hypothetical protein